MAVTRINNNQVTDAAAGNTIVGINAGTKLQPYSITATRIANNLTYGSDLTITGNLTVSGTTTNVDTVNTLIADPLITLADGQTVGTPVLDIGTIGLRGSQQSAVLAWKEDQKEFVTALSSTTVSNTTFTISTYANLHSGNTTVQGTTSLVGNLIGAVNATATITGGNLATPGTVSATGTITGGNLATGGTASATGTITGGNLATGGTVSAAGTATVGNVLTGGLVSATGNGTFGNISTAGSFEAASLSASGNITGGNLLTGGYVSATGNGTFGNISTAGIATAASTVGGVITGSSASVTGGVTAASVAGGVITGSSVSVTGTATAASTVGGVITGSSSSVTGTQTAASTVGGVITGSSSSVTGTQTAASTVGGVITGDSVSVTGTATAASTVGGVITGSSSSVTGTQEAASTVGGVITGTSSSVTGTATAASTVGGVITGSSSSVTGTQTAASTVGGVITGSSVSVSGNVTGGNVITDFIYSTGNTTLTINAQTISLNPTGNVGMNARWINGVADPINDQDAATKSYVDSVAQGLDPKASVVYATAANIAPYTYNNGTSGVGATITLNSTGNLLIDGSLVAANERVLIKNEVGAYVNTTTQSAAFNGIYVVTVAGAPGVAAVLTRSADFNAPAEIPSAFTFVEYGTVNADTGWVCTTNAPVTVGTTQILFTQFSGAGSYTAGNALSLNGTQFNVNVDSSGNATIGINGSNQLYIPAGAILTTPNIGAATGTSLSVSGAVTAASTVGGVITGSSVSVTGTATAASTVGGVITGSSSSVTGTQSAASTVGGVITGSSSSVTGTQTAASTVGGVITGSSSSVTGTQTAASTVGGVITGSSVSVTGNVDAGNTNSNVYGTTVSVTGTVTAASTVGGVITGSSVSVTGTATAASTVGGVITGSSSSVTGTQEAASTVGGVITGSSTSVTGTQTAASTVGGVITGSSSSVTGTQTAASTVGGVITGSSVSVTGNVDAGNVQTSGLISATGTATVGNLATGGTVSATGNITGGNVLTSGSGGAISGTGNITGGNILTSGVVSATSGVTAGNIVISGNTVNMLNPGGTIQVNSGNANTNFSVSGTGANVFFVDATANTASFGSSTQTVNAIVAFNSTNSILLPAGTQGQRPATGVTGMLRFNSTTNSIEIYNNSAWIGVGSTVFTVITDQQFNGDGATTAFTLGNSSTTAATIVSINGVLQIPTSAYSVSGVTLTFTEAPATGDLIDVRALTTTTTLLSLTNVSANASVGVSDTNNIVTITGIANVVGDLNVTGNATILGNVATNQIINGTSGVLIPIPNGNVIIDVGSTNDIATFTTDSMEIHGNIIPQANVTYNLGTPTLRWKDLYLAGNTIQLGNATISANATAIVMTNPAGGQTVLAGSTTTSSVAGNITGGNILTAGYISAVGNIITGTNTSSPGAIGVGTATPDAEITILANPQTSTYTLTGFSTTLGTDLHIVGADATQTRITQDTFGTGAYVAFTGRAARGTAASPTQTQSGDTIAQFTGRGFSNGSLQFGNSSTGLLQVAAAENFTDTSRATNVQILTTASGAITPTTIATFSSAAGLSVAGNITGSYILGNGSQLSGIDATQIISGTSNLKVTTSGGNIAASVGGTSNVAVWASTGVYITGLASVTGTVTAASVVGGVITGSSTSVSGTVTAASVVGGVITGSSSSVTGTVTGGNIVTAGTITVNSGAAATAIINGAGNAVGNIGSSSNYFNTVFAKATSAQYADLAEKYTADAAYAPGTVVVFGGTAEVTVNAVDADRKVAGVVSTDPGFLMNEGLDSEFAVAVALTGRVPTLVVGPVRKGDLMVAAGLGRARAEADPRVGSVIGKALEDFDGAEGTIEVVVGRF